MRPGGSRRCAGRIWSSRCNRAGLALWGGAAILAAMLALVSGIGASILESGTATLGPGTGDAAAGVRP